MNFRDDFALDDRIYMLNHSVGRPLKTARATFGEAYLTPWEQADNSVWPMWLSVADQFCAALGRLFNTSPDGFCPQPNVSSGLTKLVMSLDRLMVQKQRVLISERDFPTVGFVLQKALSDGYDQIRFIPRALDVADPSVWEDHLDPSIGMVFVSRAYSNTGTLGPLAEVVAMCRTRDLLCVADVAQSAGIVPLDLAEVTPDFMLGVSLKWLCGGPGAGFLWVNPERLPDCKPVDVGWFSHEQPFEMDVHDFRYHRSSLRFWGGTPTVAPFVFAAQSVAYFAEQGGDVLRAHNQRLVQQLWDVLGDAIVSPSDAARRSGTVVMQFGERHAAVSEALATGGVVFDQRPTGMRISPHVYNSADEMAALIGLVRSVW